MKKITFILFFIIACKAFSQTGNYQNGDLVDNFTVTDIDGEEHDLYSITAQGKYVWLDFFFVDCPPCRSTAAIFNEFYDKYGCNAGDVYALSINRGIDDDAYVRWYEEQFGGSFNHAPAVSKEGGGGAVSINFGVNAYPTYCLIGPDNKMIKRDIWPLTGGIIAFENTFPQGFDPEIMECTLGASHSESFSFNIFPTVSNGEINIDLPDSSNSSIIISNTLGQKVFENKYSERSIHLNLQLKTGVYFVTVSSGNQVATRRMIIR